MLHHKEYSFLPVLHYNYNVSVILIGLYVQTCDVRSLVFIFLLGTILYHGGRRKKHYVILFFWSWISCPCYHCFVRYNGSLLHDVQITTAITNRYCDNKVARHIILNQNFHEWIEHIEIDCHSIKEKLPNNLFYLLFIKNQWGPKKYFY